MRHLLSAAFLTASSIVCGLASTRDAGAQQPRATAMTVWDGVYTSSQANRGQDVYDKACAACHQDDLSGGGDEAAAVLRGADFFAQWNNRTLADLYRAVAEGMPKDSPGSLPPAAAADVVSFLLKKNLIPAGETELVPGARALDTILITRSP